MTVPTFENERLVGLGEELVAVLDKPMSGKKADYDELMRLKDQIRRVPTSEAELSEGSLATFSGLVVMAYRRLNEYENFWENNGEEWAG